MDSILFNQNVTKEKIEKIISQHGFNKYAYIAYTKNKKLPITIISNYPDTWLKEYKSNKFYTTDPVIKLGLESVRSYSWRDAVSIYSKEAKIFERSSHYEIEEGFTFPIHDPKGNFSALSIAKERHDTLFSDKIRGSRGWIHESVADIHGGIIKENTSASIPKNYEQLTKREEEVLHWASKGKTYFEISIILSLSVRTIKFHMENIVEKLNVSNAKHAISFAKEIEIL